MSGVRSFSASKLIWCLIAPAAIGFPAPALADGVDLVSPETVSVTGTGSFAATDGEESWVDGGFGKLSTSGPNDGG